jgi:hypothetical protein
MRGAQDLSHATAFIDLLKGLILPVSKAFIFLV